MKEVAGVLAVVLIFFGYAGYYRDIIKGKTHPHIYTWALWTLLTVLIVALQLEGDAGFAAVITTTGGVLCFGIFLLSLRNGRRYITKIDTTVAVLGLAAIGFWVIVDQPIISAFLVVIADMLAFFPTVRKTWANPYVETLSLYVWTAIRFTFALIAVEEYTILSSLWIATWVVANTSFAVFIFVRRRVVSPPAALS